jgi:hypothetical protein
VPVVLLAGYEIRHAETVVRLRPTWADNERIPLEIGDTLAVAEGDLLFPGIFGHYYMTHLRPWHFRLQARDPSGRAEGGVVRATAGGSLGILAAYRRPFPIGKPHYRSFYVLPEPIDTIVLELTRDTIAVGDTLQYRIHVLGRSGRSIWSSDLPLAAPPLIDLANYGTMPKDWTGRGRALEVGSGAITVRAGHHLTTVPFTILPAEDASAEKRPRLGSAVAPGPEPVQGQMKQPGGGDQH